MIHSGQFIDIGIGMKSGVLAETVQLFQKISLDQSKIKKPDKIYSAYNISRDENIVAFCKTGILGLTVDGVIFTDKAVYIKSGSTKRFEYTDLCNYVITRQYDNKNGEYLSNHGGILLRNSEGEIEVNNGTLFAHNVAGEEMFRALTAIQNELCQKNPVAQKKMDKTINKIFDKFRDNMRKGENQGFNNITMRTLLNQSDYFEEAAMLLAENQYRKCNKDEYKDFVDNLNIADKGLYNQLKFPDDLFSQRFISDLSDIDLNISYDFLKRLRSNLSCYDTENRRESTFVIHALVLTRLNEFHFAKIVFNEACRIYGFKSIVQAVAFHLIYGVRLMRNAYNCLTNDQDIPSYCLNATDGLGLTPLHYMFILRKQNDICDFLDEKDWSKDYSYIKDQNIRAIYDYSVIASITSHPNVRAILIKTDRELKELEDCLIETKNEERKAHETLESLDKNIFEARRLLRRLENECCFSEASEVRERLNDLEDSRYKINNIFGECRQKIEEIDEEISKKTNEKEKAVLKTVQMVKNSDSPYIRFLLKIYENRDDCYNLHDILFNSLTGQMKIYEHNGSFFLLPYEIELNLPHFIIDKNGTSINEENDYSNSVPKRLFGHTWYSDKAHIDLSTLIFEYRALAKKYHPDLCKEKYANDLFVEIKQEYEIIMSKLK